MDIRGSTCNLCGVLSPSELPVFQHTCNQDFSTCDTAVKIPFVCVHVCLRERERERARACVQVSILFCGVFLNYTVHRNSHMEMILTFEF